MRKHLKKTLGWGFAGVLILGIINTAIITHESTISGITFIKGLDEMYGITQPGRVLATKSSWKRIENDLNSYDVAETVPAAPPAPNEPEAAIGEDLQLELVEVINPKLWAKGLSNTDFSGELFTSRGTIEALTVQLPEKEEISISFAEMKGNVFQYDYAGEIYSGMLYQVDPKSFMVTLTNGPLEGTRLRFVEEFTPEQVEISETLKREHNIEMGFFGENRAPAATQKSKPADPNFVKAQLMNMDTSV